MEDLGKSFTAAEVMESAEQAAQPSANKSCLNCGAPLAGAFCHQCGQKDIPARQTLGDLLLNFISSFWSFEGKLFRTATNLLLKPGYLPSEYNKGRRESFYHPARMYVFISFVFFLILALLSTGEDKEQMNSIDLGKPAKNSIQIGSQDNPQTVAEYDSIQSTLPEAKRDDWFERMISRRAIAISEKYKGRDSELKKAFNTAIMDNFSKVFFWLLPFFAIVLRLLYIRRDFYYSEHLIFTVYYYDFFFLAGSLAMLIGLIPVVGPVVKVITGFWIYIYLLFGMKRMYGQSWPKTLMKFLLFNFAFGTLFVVAMLILVVVIFSSL